MVIRKRYPTCSCKLIKMRSHVHVFTTTQAHSGASHKVEYGATSSYRLPNTLMPVKFTQSTESGILRDPDAWLCCRCAGFGRLFHKASKP